MINRLPFQSALLAVLLAAAAPASAQMTMGLPEPEQGAVVLVPVEQSDASRIDSKSQKALELKSRARVELDNGRVEVAQRLYRRALKYTPDDEEALSGLANADYRYGFLDRATLKADRVTAGGGRWTPYGAQVQVSSLAQQGRFEEARNAASALGKWAGENNLHNVGVDAYLTAARLDAHYLRDGCSAEKHLQCARSLLRPADFQAEQRVLEYERELRRILVNYKAASNQLPRGKAPRD